MNEFTESTPVDPVGGLDRGGIQAVLQRLKELMDEKKEHLMALDRVLGDGDLGLTMVATFSAAATASAADSASRPGPLLTNAAMAMAGAAPSTMSTLVASGFLRGGKAVGNSTHFGTREAAEFFKAVVAGIIHRGKTQPGNKTIVDALTPAALALEAAQLQQASLLAAFELALTAARGGAEAAIGMKAQHGRAAYFQDESIGKEDPGCAVGVLIIQGFRDVAAGRAA